MKRANLRRKWSTIPKAADNLSKAGWSYGYVSAVDTSGRTIWITDAHRDDGKRFVVHAEEKLTAFLELETAIPRFRGVKQQQGIGDPIAAYQARLYMKIK